MNIGTTNLGLGFGLDGKPSHQASRVTPTSNLSHDNLNR